MSEPQHAVPAADTTTAPGLLRRAWTPVAGAVGTISGILPHVLHHVGPLAGAALLAGATGTLLFGALGLIVSIPFLLRLRHRFGTWRAPAIALAVFAVGFAVSSFVIGPAISGGGGKTGPSGAPPASHGGHHP